MTAIDTAAVPYCTPNVEDDRTGIDVETLRRALADNLFYVQGKFPGTATPMDYYMALAYTVRDRILQRWIASAQSYHKPEVRAVAYLSAEYLLGPHLANNLVNLDIAEPVREAVKRVGLDLDELIEQEEEPGLGNGGLGRLAACYMESLASLEIPAIGYGIRYEFGIFDQRIRNGWQVEVTDKWLQFGNPWEIMKADMAVEVKFGGRTESYYSDQGQYRVRWVPDYTLKGIPYDTPILGYKVNTANTLRLWKAEASESFDFQRFNQGDYYGAVQEKTAAENLTKVLYPNDEQIQGKELRLQQQYFFVSCSLQDMIRIHQEEGQPLEALPAKFAAQLNDTHPAVGVAELMRLLVDEHHMDWDAAWEVTRNTFAYTNHTLLPEALEKWPLDLFGRILPRHLEIIFELNSRFLDYVRLRFPNDEAKLTVLSMIDESDQKYIRMANLATVGSFAVNGVAKLHSELIKTSILKDFHELWPNKITNVTNGVTPRRWMALSNPPLRALLNDKIGEGWLKHLEELQQVEAFVDDADFCDAWRAVKQSNKDRLTARIKRFTGIDVDPHSMFDVQVKRIHEYKRQHLNALHIITLYNRIKQNPQAEIVPRTFIFGGKAAPGYHMAKLMIKLITSIGEVVNRDPEVAGRLKVVFLPDYNVTNSQPVYPAADLSEQISTAGKEASGTGNMKFSLNGALTIGTLDGANVEIREAVGQDNFFLFGLTVDEVHQLKSRGYSPRSYVEGNANLQTIFHQLETGVFSHGDRALFRQLIDNLLNHDPFLLLADYQSYIDCQEQVSQTYQDTAHWTRLSILNSARAGYFSSDRSIRDYAKEIWNVQSRPVNIQDHLQANAAFTVTPT
ncbi:MAG: glycogen/starch/alpha-glucan phosphorylase [Cyanobacteria bacterium J06632_22]